MVLSAPKPEPNWAFERSREHTHFQNIDGQHLALMSPVNYLLLSFARVPSFVNQFTVSENAADDLIHP